MNEKSLSYADFWRLRRSLGSINPPVVFCEQVGSNYNVWMRVENTLCITSAEGDDIADFESSKKANCNIYPKITPETVQTHNYADSSDWVFGASNNLFVINPTTGEVFTLLETKLSFDKDLSLPEPMLMVLWSAQAAPCPAFDDAGKSPTAFGTPAFNPGTGTGWITKAAIQVATGMKQQYFLGAQEVTHYIYMSAGVPQYVAVVHSFNSIQDLKTKSSHRTDGVITEAIQKYLEPVHLRDSYNERIEVYSAGNLAHTAPNGTASRGIFYGLVANEF